VTGRGVSEVDMRGTVSGWSVITGASSGIGAALAVHSARAGGRLVLVGRDEARLAAVVDDCRAVGATDVRSLRIDLRDRTGFARGLAAAIDGGPIDRFIGCAGILDGRRDGEPVEDGDTAHRVLEVNLVAAIDAVHAVLPGMIERQRGGILLVASLAGLAPLPDAPAYSASKAGLVSYAVALGDALRGFGIRVAVACPGYVTTPLSRRHIGPHPGEIDADRAAEKILGGFSRGRTIITFPLVTGWLSRLALLAPTFVRRQAMETLRFHVEVERRGGDAPPD
jgi:short-subunit dehydrogenase